MNWEQYKVITGENITLDDKIQDLDNKMRIENFVVDFSNRRQFGILDQQYSPQKGDILFIIDE